MRRFFVSFFAAAFVLAGALTQSLAATGDSASGTWTVYKEGRGAKTTCWAIMENEGKARLNGSHVYVAVTKFPKKPLELSVYSEKRLPKSAGLTLSIGQRSYNLQSTGTAAWLADPDHKRAIEDLKVLGASRRNANFSVSIPKAGSFDFSAKGFTPALSLLLKSCK